MIAWVQLFNLAGIFVTLGFMIMAEVYRRRMIAFDRTRLERVEATVLSLATVLALQAAGDLAGATRELDRAFIRNVDAEKDQGDFN
jgi:hypothetical protein